METIRRWWMALVGVYVSLLIPSAVHWLTGLGGMWLLPVVLVCAGGGAAAGLAQADELTPMTSRDRRDALIGWSAVGVLLATLPLGVLVGVWDR
jgi:hypothetical protein